METVKESLQVRTLGSFSIQYNGESFPQVRKRSAQVELLIIYLIMNRRTAVTNSQLIDLLWPDRNADRPDGALRNLIYRARKELDILVPDQNIIISKSSCYFWNQDIECIVDYEQIVKAAKSVEQEIHPVRKYEKCMSMLKMYDSVFLPEYNHKKWISDTNDALERICTEAMLKTLELLKSQERYSEILKITEHHNAQKIRNMRIDEIRLYAYYCKGRINQGLTLYRQLVNHYYSNEGIEVSQNLKDIYALLLKSKPDKKIDVAQLEDSLNSEEENTTFYCDFDVFKNIYQVNARAVKRSMEMKILTLVTLEDTSHKLLEDEMNEESNILKRIISVALRKNDIFSQFNKMQYSLILTASSYSGAKIAMERIKKKYDAEKKHKDMTLSYEFKKIE